MGFSAAALRLPARLSGRDVHTQPTHSRDLVSGNVGRASRARMKLSIDLSEPFVGYVGVDLRRAYVAMS